MPALKEWFWALKSDTMQKLWSLSGWTAIKWLFIVPNWWMRFEQIITLDKLIVTSAFKNDRLKRFYDYYVLLIEY